MSEEPLTREQREFVTKWHNLIYTFLSEKGLAENEAGRTFQCKAARKKEQFQFKCTRCGDCCRGIKESVMLESFDAYQLARFLRQTDPAIQLIDDMLLKYAVPVPLTDTGFPIYVLKTLGEDDTCVFLRENGCAVYAARPRTCHLYPITVGPGENGREFEYLLCREKPHHFVGGMVRTKDWLRENFKQEYQEFVRAEYEGISRLGRLIAQIPKQRQPRAIVAMLFARYYNRHGQQEYCCSQCALFGAMELPFYCHAPDRQIAKKKPDCPSHLPEHVFLCSFRPYLFQ